MRFDKLSALPTVRIMIVGYPGGGKTGALACLANAGFKLRILDFDGNLESLAAYTTPEGKRNIDVATFEDELRAEPTYIGVKGLPTAFANAFKMMDSWKYTTPDGEEVDLGRSRDWGPDTIVVLDTGTGMGRAAKRRAMAIANRTPLNLRDTDWGVAMSEQESFVERLTASRNRHHTIINFHLKMVGPRPPRKGDNDAVEKIKAAEAELIPTRLCPSSLGHLLPQTIAEHAGVMLLAEKEHKMNKTRHVIRTVAGPELDLKIPADLPATLPIEDALVTVFSALGASPEKCLKAAKAEADAKAKAAKAAATTTTTKE